MSHKDNVTKNLERLGQTLPAGTYWIREDGVAINMADLFELISEGGGASAAAVAGDDSTYSNVKSDFTTSGSGFEITLSKDNVGGKIITKAMIASGSLEILDDSAGTKESVQLDNFTWNSTTKVLDVTNCTGAISMTSSDTINLSIGGDRVAYVAVQDAKQVNVLNQDSTNRTGSEPLIDVTNVAVATYRVSFTMEQFRAASIHWAVTGGTTVKMYTSNDPDDDTSAIGNWIQDISGSAPSGTDTSGHYFMDTRLICKQIMLEYTTTTTSNAINFWVARGN